MSAIAAVDLSSLRRGKGLSKLAASKKAKVGYATWCRAEDGEKISERSAKKIADVFGLVVVDAFPEPDEVEAAAA